MPMPMTMTMNITSSRAGISIPPDSAVTKLPKFSPKFVIEAMPTTIPAPAQGMATAMAPREPDSSALTESSSAFPLALKTPAMPCAWNPSQARVTIPSTIVTQIASRVAELNARPDMIW
ncbi:hypothetical protein D3C84_495070 [compost metagenome]